MALILREVGELGDGAGVLICVWKSHSSPHMCLVAETMVAMRLDGCATTEAQTYLSLSLRKIVTREAMPRPETSWGNRWSELKLGGRQSSPSSYSETVALHAQ